MELHRLHEQFGFGRLQLQGWGKRYTVVKRVGLVCEQTNVAVGIVLAQGFSGRGARDSVSQHHVALSFSHTTPQIGIEQAAGEL